MLRRAFKFSILVAIFIIGGISAAFAETFQDYDRTLLRVNPDGTTTYSWASHYPRIWDGNNWVNHITTETSDLFEVRTANISFDFDKNTCEFTLHDPKDGRTVIPSFTSTLLIDDIPVPLQTCNFTNLVYDTDTITFTAQRTQYDIHYVVNSNGSVEWTYASPVNVGISRVFAIEEVCDGCPITTPDVESVNFGEYYYDSKNNVHGALAELEFSSCVPREGLECPHANPRFNARYEQTIQNGESLDIDPSFSYTDADELQSISTGNGPLGGNPACDASGSPTNSTSNLYPYTGLLGSGSNSGCGVVVAQWNLASIPTVSDISNINLKVDTGTTNPSGTPQSCDILESTDQLNANGPGTIIDNIFNDVGAEYINADTTLCDSASETDYIIALPSAAETDMENNINGSPVNDMNKRFGVVFAYDDFTRTDNVREEGYDFTQVEIEFEYTLFALPSYTISQTVTPIGNIHRIDGTINVLAASPQANITDIWVRQNGTMVNANHTNHNQTAPFSINYGPFWTFNTDDNIKNVTTTVRLQHVYINYTDEAKEYTPREYDPDYFTAIIPSEGNVNYTFPSAGGLHVNRDKGGATFQIECTCLDYADAFANNTAGDTWINNTSVAALAYTCPQGTAITACYNDNLLFITSYPANSSTILVSGTAMFDQLGGFLGAPAALLVVLAIYSLGTGRNFPIISVVAMAALGVMGALGLMVLSGEIWALLMVITGLSIFGVRKFF